MQRDEMYSYSRAKNFLIADIIIYAARVNAQDVVAFLELFQCVSLTIYLPRRPAYFFIKGVDIVVSFTPFVF